MAVSKTLPLFFLIMLVACSPSSNLKEEPIDQKLMYIGVRDRNYDIYLSDQDGENEERLTNQLGFDWGPRWWPSKNAIVHYTQDTAGNFRNRMMNMEGNELEYDFQELSDFIASPDGRYALYTQEVDSQSHIFKHDLTQKKSNDITPINAYHGRQKWSPDSKWIAFISDRDGSNNLFIYNIETEATEQLTNDMGRVKYITWSPTSNRIAFTREIEEPKTDHDIFIIDIKSRQITQFTDTPDQGETEISWSPMGDKIAYHGKDGDKDEIYTIDLLTKEITQITNGEGYHGEPSWIPIYP